MRPTHKFKKAKRVGRGGKRGTYSGKGMKGQNSRSGRKFIPAIRGLIKRYPKLRGYNFGVRGDEIAVINLEVLEKNFEAGQTINPKVLVEKRLVRRLKGRAPEVKILGSGKLTKNFIIENCLISKQAKEAIEKANGSVK